MSDLISRKMVIEALYNHYEVNNKAQNATMDECIMLVKNIPSAEPKWIPVAERLPEEDVDVLVTGVEAIGGGRVYAVKVWDSDRWRPESAPSVWWKAWMPLPEPYRPEEVTE